MNRERSTIDRHVLNLFERQHGLASDRQLRALGVSWGRERRMLDNGRWRRAAPTVVAIAGAPVTWHQRAMAATLSCGPTAMLSGVSAARLHGLDGFLDVDTVEVGLPAGAHDHTPPGVIVRWSRHISSADRHVIAGIPVTIQPVTLIHLAASGENADKGLDSVRQGKSPAWFRQHFERWSRPHIVGPAEMMRLLDERMGRRLPRSWFQRLAKHMLTEAGVRLVDEWPVRDASGRLLAELDLADPDLLVGVECQSIEYHDSPADRARDIRRKRALRAIGWDIVELWWSDLNRMDDVVTEVRSALDRARRLRS